MQHPIGRSRSADRAAVASKLRRLLAVKQGARWPRGRAGVAGASSRASRARAGSPDAACERCARRTVEARVRARGFHVSDRVHVVENPSCPREVVHGGKGRSKMISHEIGGRLVKLGGLVSALSLSGCLLEAGEMA